MITSTTSLSSIHPKQKFFGFYTFLVIIFLFSSSIASSSSLSSSSVSIATLAHQKTDIPAHANLDLLINLKTIYDNDDDIFIQRKDNPTTSTSTSTSTTAPFLIGCTGINQYTSTSLTEGLIFTLPRSSTDSSAPDLDIAANATTIQVFGVNLSPSTQLWVSDKVDSCIDRLSSSSLTNVSVSNTSALFDIDVSVLVIGRKYYLCLDAADPARSSLVPPITVTLEKLEVEPAAEEDAIPLPVRLVALAFLLTLSGLFSGLNLGVMALDTNSLQVIMESGSAEERQYAKVIYPIRKKGNYLLCTLLLGNVMVNNTIAILLGDLTTGLAAILGSTAAIVVLGEIFPQSLCSRHGLKIGAKTIWVTKFFMLVTFPASYPISKILDYVLGEEIGTVYKREALKSLLKVTAKATDLLDNEVVILTGALEFCSKQVKQIMTKLEDVFMIDYHCILDFETMSSIVDRGHSRIPVYEGKKTNIVGLLYFKDLAFVDPDDNIPLKTVLEFHKHEVHFVMDDTHLDRMLEEFKKGKSHICIVQWVNNEGDGDPFYEPVGIATLEDVLEELIQSEINDEYDQVADNQTRKKIPRKKLDYSQFAKPNTKQKLPPQMSLACFSYLQTAVPAFSPKILTDTMLKRIIEHSELKTITYDPSKEEAMTIYFRNKPTDTFALILQGKVEVVVGAENFTFIAGPFTPLAAKAIDMSSPIYISDFVAKVQADTQLLLITRSDYAAAVKASNIEKASQFGTSATDTSSLAHKNSLSGPGDNTIVNINSDINNNNTNNNNGGSSKATATTSKSSGFTLSSVLKPITSALSSNPRSDPWFPGGIPLQTFNEDVESNSRIIEITDSNNNNNNNNNNNSTSVTNSNDNNNIDNSTDVEDEDFEDDFGDASRSALLRSDSNKNNEPNSLGGNSNRSQSKK